MDTVSQENKLLYAECIKAINTYRQRHLVPALTYNSEVAVTSQRWAESLAIADKMSHNEEATYRDEPLGENVLVSWSSTGIYPTGNKSLDYEVYEFFLFKLKKGVFC